MRKLVITEKANAARRISTILSDGKTASDRSSGANVISFTSGSDEYDVVSLRGHIIELDYPPEYNNWSSGSPSDLVYASQVKVVRAKSILDTIRSISKKCDEIVIATDYDREGELIGVETVREAGIDLASVRRARFSALTKGEVDNAFSSLTYPDTRLADAAEARQIIDLAWGAVLTRSVSLSSGQVGKNFLSVGRVQSPTLKILVDRHQEIESFVPKPYWSIKGRFGMLAFEGKHVKNPFWEKSESDAILDKCKDAKKAKVTSFDVRTKEEFRPHPFDTTTMQVEANKIGIQPAVAMKIAEDLYTGGYISYPRTENTEYPRSLSLKGVLERLRESSFKEEVEEILAQDKISPSRGKRRTTDHPPIYPTSAATQDKMHGDKWKLYELIVRRFLATLGPNAEAEITECHLDVNGEDFKAEGYKLKKQGWKKYYGKYISTTESKVPVMEAGAEIDVRKITQEESETKPPYRYNQGSLIQEMDRLNLGTKSTRHDIIGKLFSRNYIQGNYLIPTVIGIALTRALEKHGGGITEPNMTARLEDDMQKISLGEKTLGGVVSESQEMLYSVAVKINGEGHEMGLELKTASMEQTHLGVCPTCGNNITIKKSKKGNFIGCDGYPECTRAYPIPRGAMIQMVEDVCPICKLPQLKIIRKGTPPQINCIDPKCSGNVSKNELGECPLCGGRIRMMYSKTGKRFAGCSEWPKCNQTYPLRQTGVVNITNEKCDSCGSPMIIFGSRKECINMECPSRGGKTPKKSTRVGVVKKKVETKK